MDVENNTDGVISKIVLELNEQGKQPLQTSEEDGECKQNKRKINDEDNDDEPAMSKKKLKKIQKQQKWLEKKTKRKEINKEKKQEKKKWKAEMRKAGVEIQKVKTTKMAQSTCKQRVVLDMSYDELMSNKDLCKCSNQILRCYGINRRMENPMQLYFCSYEGKIKEIMAKHNGCEFWDIKYVEDSFDKVFKKEEIVYLTSDSLNILDSVDESKVYIIGGLVDHNSCKGASLKVAENLGIAHARLPIDKYINMKSRKILTINHVYEIISKVVTGVSWKDALMDTLPKRYTFSAKDEEDSMDYEDLSKDTNEHADIKSNDENEHVDIKSNNDNSVEQNITIS